VPLRPQLRYINMHCTKGMMEEIIVCVWERVLLFDIFEGRRKPAVSPNLDSLQWCSTVELPTG
jgi:hypothetical protein